MTYHFIDNEIKSGIYGVTMDSSNPLGLCSIKVLTDMKAIYLDIKSE